MNKIYSFISTLGNLVGNSAYDTEIVRFKDFLTKSSTEIPTTLKKQLNTVLANRHRYITQQDFVQDLKNEMEQYEEIVEAAKTKSKSKASKNDIGGDATKVLAAMALKKEMGN